MSNEDYRFLLCLVDELLDRRIKLFQRQEGKAVFDPGKAMTGQINTCDGKGFVQRR